MHRLTRFLRNAGLGPFDGVDEALITSNTQNSIKHRHWNQCRPPRYTRAYIIVHDWPNIYSNMSRFLTYTRKIRVTKIGQFLNLLFL